MGDIRTDAAHPGLFNLCESESEEPRAVLVLPSSYCLGFVR